MAKCLFGVVVTDARGKLGGTCFQTGKFGAWLGPKSTPRNPATPAQITIRQLTKNLGVRWGYVLDQDQRDGWNALGLTTDRLDVFNNVIHITGFMMYMLVNQNLRSIGHPILDDNPADILCGSPGAVTVLIAGAPPTILVDVSVQPTGTEHALILAIRPRSPGLKYIGKQPLIVHHTGAAEAGPWDITTQYTNRFGTLYSGLDVTVVVNFIDATNGGKGTEATGSDIIP